MKTLTRIIASVCSLAALVSCSTKSIDMYRLAPGIIDIPKSASLRMDNLFFNSGSDEDKSLSRAFEGEWQKRRDITPGNGMGPVFSVRFSDTNYRFSQGRGYDMRTAANFYINGTSKRKIYNYGYNTQSTPYDRLSRDIINDLLPGDIKYWAFIETDKEKNPIMRQAVYACQDGQWRQGLNLAMESLKTVPNDPETWYLLGMIHRQLSDYVKSQECFQKAYSIKPDKKYADGMNDNKIIEADEVKARSQMNS